jgi:signal transduction histidine kinase/ActR/RegA family two-component response regulator
MMGPMVRDRPATDLLLSLARLAIERRTLAEVFGSFASRLVEGAAVDYASLLARDTEANTWRVVAIYPEERARDVGGVPRVQEADVETLRRHPEGLLYRTEGDSPVLELFRSFGLQWGWSSLLTLEEEVVGLFTVARTASEPFNDEEQEFLRAAARFLSHALREEVRLAIAQRWASRSRLLNDVSILLGGGAPVETLFVELAGRGQEELPFDLLLLFRAVEGQLRASGAHPGTVRPWSHLSRQEAAWLERRVAALRKPEIAATEELPEGIARRLLGQGVRRIWLGRLDDPEGTLGALVVGWRSERRPTPTDDWFVRTLATLIAQALGRERALARARLEAEQREVLARAAAVAAAHASTEETVRALAGAVGRIVPRPVIGWAFVGESSFRVAAGRNAPLGVLPREALPGLPLTGDIVFSFERLPEPLAAAGARSPSVAVVAASSGGELVGHLLAASRASGFRFDERTVGLVSLVANVVAPALRNARLAEDADRLRRTMEVILESLSEAILLLDKDVRLVWANEGGRFIADLVDPERRLRGVVAHLPRLPKEAGEALATALQQRQRAVGRTSWVIDGRRRWWDFELVPLEHPEFSVVCVASDVTAEVEAKEREERHREEMERASRLATIGEIVSGVAHELNNPLTSVLGFAELAAQSPAGAGVREELELIRREALRARNIVRDLLFIARPGTPERKPFDLRDVVDHVARLREAGWRQGGLTSEVDVGVARPVMGSEGQVTQVVLNLVTNAEQALEGRAGARLWIRAWEEGDHAVVEVGDNGPGVPPEARDRIFEPFFTTKSGRGTGLGLSLSRSIVESHGGRIWLENEAGATCFRFTLPLAASDAEPEEDTRDGRGNARPCRVLVVDDEPGIRRMAERLLASAGHQVRCAATVGEAVAAVREWKPDAVLCDYRLQGETADAVLEEIRRVDPAYVGRVLLVTGATSDRGVVELAERYGLPVLAKPFAHEELLAAIAAFTPRVDPGR